MIKPRTMPGVLELLPREQIVFQRMADTIRGVFERFGFLPIETPAIELAEVLLTKTGGETERQVYFVQSTGSLEVGDRPTLALRFDLTVPLARYVAEHENSLAFPFRRYQIQRVYRGESPQRGRFREFYQCDIDIVGRETLDVRHDAEIPAVIAVVFSDLGLGAFTIRVNNRRLMRGLLETLGFTDEAGQAEVLREVDKLEKRGPEAVSNTLRDLGMSPDQVERLIQWVGWRSRSYQEAFEILDRLPHENDTAAQGMAELRVVLDTVKALGVPESRFALDLSIARGLDYYTGTVYETTLDAHPELGSICSGGRYDDLASHYGNQRLPGVGISIGLTRLFWQLREIGLVSAGSSPIDALVGLMNEADLEYSLGIASELRAAGLAVETVLAPSKLAKQFKYADKAGIRTVIIAGSNEREIAAVTVKDLVTGGQTQVARTDLVSHLRRETE